MIYWHVERKSACVYSQLKSASSEAAAMIEGVLHHCTDMAIEKNYTDSPGRDHNQMKRIILESIEAHRVPPLTADLLKELGKCN